MRVYIYIVDDIHVYYIYISTLYVYMHKNMSNIKKLTHNMLHMFLQKKRVQRCSVYSFAEHALNMS